MKVDRAARALALMQADEIYLQCGTVLAGIDEAGRGPLAGNVVAACVVMPREPVLSWVDDSKRLSPARREKVFEEIMAIALYAGIGEASPLEIDQINILNATKLAMRRAAEGIPAELFLIDAVTRVGLSGRECPIVHGDAVSYAIAAASILAKVTRDRQMCEMDARYPVYGFAQHKGYGTPTHIAALKLHGPCDIHRRTFIGKFVV